MTVPLISENNEMEIGRRNNVKEYFQHTTDEEKYTRQENCRRCTFVLRGRLTQQAKKFAQPF